MSRGLGWVQRECLRIIGSAPKNPTTYQVAAEVFQVKADEYGDRMITEAQHVATKRALASLRSKGLVKSREDAEIEDGKKSFQHVRPGTHRAERCCFWTIAGKPFDELDYCRMSEEEYDRERAKLRDGGVPEEELKFRMFVNAPVVWKG
jgi:hypothetical protein